LFTHSARNRESSQIYHKTGRVAVADAVDDAAFLEERSTLLQMAMRTEGLEPDPDPIWLQNPDTGEVIAITGLGRVWSWSRQRRAWALVNCPTCSADAGCGCAAPSDEEEL
jgi:hypothetical protein